MEDERNRIGRKISIAGICCNIVLAGAKLAAGLLSGMISVVADSVNNFSDAGASIISLVGFRLSSKPADDDHPFGHARYEYISGLAVAFLVMLAGAELFRSSIEKIITPEEPDLSALTFVILAVSIVVKLLMALLYTKTGRKINSGTIIAAGKDSLNDTISTGAVLVSSLISYFSGYNLDAVMGLLVSCFVLFSGISLVKDTISPLLGTTPDPEKVDEIEKKIMSYEGVLGTHDLMVHDYGPGHFFASVHVEVPAERNVLECHEIIDKIEQDFRKDMNIQLIIHYDPIVTDDKKVGELRKYLSEQVKEINSSLKIHDLRIVPGENNTNVIFDCVIPHSLAKEENDIVAEIKLRLAEKYPDHTAVIKVDHSFISLGE